MALGIMGGTFDPIHYGHLRIAEEARERFALDTVLFVPSGQPYHRGDLVVTDAGRRLAMTELAIASNPRFAVSRVDIDRPGPTYTVDTVRDIRTQYPHLESLYFITGADAILQIEAWKSFDELRGSCRFIAATRPGFDLASARSKLSPSSIENIEFMEIPGIHISSTELRQRVGEGKSIKYLTPESVEAYIHAEGLYR